MTTLPNNPTVHEMRKAGYKVRVIHQREKNPDQTLASKGGKTTVEITTPEGVELRGIAQCSKKEGFNRKKGLRIAIGRATAYVPF